MKNRNWIWAFVAVSIAVVVFVLANIGAIPEESSTALNMVKAKSAIIWFAQKNGRLPHSLDEVRDYLGKYRKYRDGWGNLLRYEIETNNVVVLSSDGDPRLLTGTNQVHRMIGRFGAQQVGGEWTQTSVNWIEDPLADYRHGGIRK